MTKAGKQERDQDDEGDPEVHWRCLAAQGTHLIRTIVHFLLDRSGVKKS